MSEDDPRLYLITPLLDDADAFAAAFVAALEAGDVACVLLRFAPTADAKAIARCLVPLAQQRGVACLIGDTQLAARAEADGVHVAAPGAALDAALKAMKPKHIVGTGGGVSRDDAMRAGETGSRLSVIRRPRRGAHLPADSRARRLVVGDLQSRLCRLCASAGGGWCADRGRSRFRRARNCGLGRPARRCCCRCRGRSRARVKAHRRMRHGVFWLCCILPALWTGAALATPPPAAAASAVHPTADADFAYGAYQRGLYLTAMNEAKN